MRLTWLCGSPPDDLNQKGGYMKTILLIAAVALIVGTGSMVSVTATQQAGVVLWDEPRKGLPPARTGADATVNGSVSTSFTIHSR